MAKKEYKNDNDRLQAYLAKIRKVLKTIGNSICFLHKQNIVHGNLHSQCCGKFEDGWKLSEFLGVQSFGDLISTSHMIHSLPPESVTFKGGKGHVLKTITASPVLDIWAFGKLMFEVLVGKPLLPHDLTVDRKHDQRYLQSLGNWNQDDLTDVVTKIENSSNGTLAADLISHCLCKRPELRPRSMDEVLSHSFWTASLSQRRSTVGTRKYSTSKPRFQC
jgi:serine/threonine protein kinase